jgi:hypothetical protein
LERFLERKSEGVFIMSRTLFFEKKNMPLTSPPDADVIVRAFLLLASLKKFFSSRFLRHFFLALSSALLLLSLPTQAADHDLDLSQGNIEINVSLSTYTIGGGAATNYDVLDNLIILQSVAGATNHTISVSMTNPLGILARRITLKNVDIDASETAGACAFNMASVHYGTVTLTLEGSNTLKSGAGCAGLHTRPTGGQLVITGTGGLVVNGGGSSNISGAGIGGSSGEDGGRITIEGDVYVDASGGGCGAGIGGGSGNGCDAGDSNGGTLTIRGNARVFAYGGSVGGAGIGGGYGGNGGNIIISESAQVVARGGSSAAGIGGGIGRFDGSGGGGGNILITDAASVTATARNGDCAAGIGSGRTSASSPAPAGTIRIDTSGTVTATGGEAYANTGASIGQGCYGYLDTRNGAGLASFTHPTDRTVDIGSNASFTVEALREGSTLPNRVYAWEVSTDGGATWTATVGNSATLNVDAVTAAMNGNQYRATATLSGGGLDAGSSITYVGHAATLTVPAAPPSVGTFPNCTRTTSFWLDNPAEWPVSGMTLGAVSYAQSHLMQILAEPIGANGLIALAQAVIAAKLNIAAGADNSGVSLMLTQADTRIDLLMPPPIGIDTLTMTLVGGLANSINLFNDGYTGPGQCPAPIAPTITTPIGALPDGTVGVWYNVPLVAIDGPTGWGVASGVLPNGLSLDPITGVISGTPTMDGLFHFEVEATNASGASSPVAFSININPAAGPTPRPGSATSIPTLSQWTLLLLGALTAAMALLFLSFRDQAPESRSR